MSASQIFQERDELPYKEEHLTIVAKIREFSNTSIHNPDESATSMEYIDYDVRGFQTYPIAVLANDIKDDSSEACVSLYLFSGSTTLCSEDLSDTSHAEVTCLISAIDVEGDRRLAQSFVICRDFTKRRTDPTFHIDNVYSRNVLLERSSELLPNDTLTLHVDVVLKEYFFGDRDIKINFPKLVELNFETRDGPDGIGHYLWLDSDVAKRLAEESTYFERMLVTQMVEGNSRYMRIPKEEYPVFLEIVKILWKLSRYDTPLDYAFSDIFVLYVTAHKYGIPTVMDVCRCWLKLVCFNQKNALNISKFANSYDDNFLRQIAEDFLRKEGVVEKKASKDNEDTDGFTSVTPHRKGRWTYATVFDVNRSMVYFNFQFQSSNARKENEITRKFESEREHFDFLI